MGVMDSSLEINVASKIYCKSKKVLYNGILVNKHIKEVKRMNQLKVWVSAWQRERRVAIGNDSIVFQVTLTCPHCSTCGRRVHMVQEALAQSGANWQWVQPPMGWPDVRCVSIERINGQEPLAQLRESLGLQIDDSSAVAVA